VFHSHARNGIVRARDRNTNQGSRGILIKTYVNKTNKQKRTVKSLSLERLASPRKFFTVSKYIVAFAKDVLVAGIESSQ
jgi:hypothetical protein